MHTQVASLIGNEGDATPFTDVTVENISQTLHQLGYQSRGWEVMYNGHTGVCVENWLRLRGENTFKKVE